MVRRDDINLRHGQQFRLQLPGLTVHHQMVRIQALDVARDLSRPLGGWGYLIAGFPAQDGLVIAITHAGQVVWSQDQKMDRLF